MPIVDTSPEEDHLSEALAVAVDALKRQTDSAQQWVQLGHVLKDADALDEAETAYRTAIRCDGTEWDPRLHLAHLLKRRDRLQDALGVFEEIRTLPDAPNVDHDIAGLRVALLPENGTIRRPATIMPASRHTASFRTLLRDLSGDLAPAGVDTVAPPDLPEPAAPVRLTCSQDLKAELVPKANLVIRDGHLIGTTTNPQFEIRCANACAPGWVEIEFGIRMEAPVIEPVLYVEHAPYWQRFSVFRLALRNGHYHAVCRLDGPVLSLRLDPSDAAGPFMVTHFSVKRIGLARAIRHAWQRDRAATRQALSWRRSKDVGTMEEAIARCLSNPAMDAYQRWIRRHETPSRLPAETVRRNVARWPKKPELTVLLDWNPDETPFPADTLASLAGQSYPHWTLDVLTPRPVTASERQSIDNAVGGAGFHTGLASFIESRQGGHVVHVEAGNTLSPAALLRLAEEIFARRSMGVDVVYSDEDHVLEGTRSQPLFKPDWDPDFEAATRYAGNFLALRRDRLGETLARLPGTAGWADARSALLSEIAPDTVLHIPEVLHHRHRREDATDPVEPALRAPPEGWPHVTLMIPTRDSVEILRGCIDSLLLQTDYPSFDIIVVDNGSTEPDTLSYFEEISGGGQVSVLPAPGPFNFSRLNNLAAAAAKGTVLGLVNNDVLAMEPRWLKAMVGEAVRPEIGAVGAKLLYPSGHVQHAGIACGVGFLTAHPQKFRDGRDRGYMDSLVAPRSVSAVTAACLIVEKRKYDAVGGLDEAGLPVAFNDVDFCLKLGAAGYRNLFTPFARLVHLESATRGLDMTGEKAERLRQEARIMLDRWKGRMRIDPYYNINLTPEREDCSIRE